ncbi:MAG: gamma-glutamylcyclotransferase [Pedobacter sp.]|nr:MAG: gamma-glutamylcyclotransferase [Pedobacter sp.]
MSHNLFSYGTLQDVDVQLKLFNRKLTGKPDSIKGYKLSRVEIKDDEVVAISGLTHHLILIPGDIVDSVDGMVFEITNQELVLADDYEAEDYQRVLVPAISGINVWVYVQADSNMK